MWLLMLCVVGVFNLCRVMVSWCWVVLKCCLILSRSNMVVVV